VEDDNKVFVLQFLCPQKKADDIIAEKKSPTLSVDMINVDILGWVSWEELHILNPTHELLPPGSQRMWVVIASISESRSRRSETAGIIDKMLTALTDDDRGCVSDDDAAMGWSERGLQYLRQLRGREGGREGGKE
jgi:hypothetical protein